jgi:shikimate kinase
MIISLMGFMGSGKSTFGKRLALHLDMPFIDLDHYLEEHEKRSINTIFEEDGEAVFRNLETKYLTEIVKTKKACVLSLGGGTPCSESNWEILKDTKSIYIKRTHLFLSKILIAKKHKRPLIKDLNDDEIKQLITHKMDERSSFYERADLIFHGYGSKKALEKRLVDKTKQLVES